MYMQIAEVVSRRSTCMRRNVGTVIVQHNNIISIGYNGPLSGQPHCFGKECAPQGFCSRAIHSEMNAITRMRAVDASRELIMYTTESPCPICATAIMGSPITSLYYLHLYRITEGIDRISQRIPVFRMTPSGYLVDHTTGELIDAAQS
jgi:dCMP deaminase